MVKIIIYPRIHITLIGMDEGGYRINGGIGIALSNPTIMVNASPSQYFELTDKRQKRLRKNHINRLAYNINNIQKEFGMRRSISVTISGNMPTNSGFGSGTAIRLACIESLFIANNVNYKKDDLIKMSGRGGTSGIGIKTYFHGGFVFDIGHKNDRIAPSNLLENCGRQSLMVKNDKMPKWNFGVCIPTQIKTLNQKEEERFFERTVPISTNDVYRTLYQVLYGIYASIVEDDIDTFSKALIEIQKCSWKNAERNIYGQDIIEIENILYSCGAKAVGMSSLGPCLFFVSDNNALVIKKAKNLNNNSFILFNVKPKNSGRKLSIC